MRRVVLSMLREPLLHFLIIGAGLFALFSVLNPGREAPAQAAEIVVTPQIAQQLAQQYSAVWRRPPTPDVLDGLIDSFLREEALVREARALSLDVGDSVVRQRLAQKMAFLSDAAAAAEAPTQAELEAYRAQHAERYRMPPQIAFSQVFLGEDPGDELIEQVRAELNSDAPWQEAGVRSLLPPQVPLSSPEQLDRTFGTGMFDAVSAQAEAGAAGAGEGEGEGEGKWTGPVPSAYGAHFVRITRTVPSREPPLAEIQDTVERDWVEARKFEARQDILEQLLARYRVERPSRDELETMLQ